MPEYRYQAAQSNGTPVYGTVTAESEAQLRADLAARGLNLIVADSIVLDQSFRVLRESIPRLSRLRIGEHLREAFLTGLPAHQAVRAIAAEPVDHPLLSVMPWCFGLGCLLLLPAIGWDALLPDRRISLAWPIAAGCGGILLAWLAIKWLFEHRVRGLLFELADRLQASGDVAAAIPAVVSSEVAAVMTARVTDRQKAMSVAELIPTLAVVSFYRQRFICSIQGILMLMSFLFLGVYLLMWLVIPEFRDIYDQLGQLGTELPVMTQWVLSTSTMFTVSGFPGFAGSCVLLCGMMAAVYAGMSWGPAAEVIAQTPIVGLPVRWLMQARAAHVLAAMLSHDCDRGESLKAATAATGFPAVRREGERMIEQLALGNRISSASTLLSGLPLSLLHGGSASGTAAEISGGARLAGESATGDSAARLSQCFRSIASMLEQSSEGHGRLMATLLQTILTLVAAVMIGGIVFGIFLPFWGMMTNLGLLI
jgi:type II secretory pathway component PulF